MKKIVPVFIFWWLGALSVAWGQKDEPLKFSGDLRLRYDHEDQPGKKARGRLVVRWRLGTKKPVNDTLTFGGRLSTGGNNPISANSTFTDFFGRPEMRVDQAYLAWTPRPDLTVVSGKFTNPFQSTEMVWDNDLNPAGVAVTSDLTRDPEARTKVGNVAAILTVNEVKGGSDFLLYADQVQADFGRGRQAALAYYACQSPNSLAQAYEAKTFTYNDTNRRQGGAFVAEGFKMLNLLLQYSPPTKGEIPLTATLDWVTNTEAKGEETGYRLLLQATRGKGVGAWQATLGYTDIEADATVAAFMDSNWSGTDCRGFMLGYQYEFAPNAQVALTYYLCERPFANVDTAHRVYLDFKTKF